MPPPGLSVFTVDWAEHQTRCLAIRRAVFIEEQQISAAIEIDGRDPDCVHALATLDGADVATGRMLPGGKIGRVAVRPELRGRGIGRAIMDCLMAEARAQALPAVVLAAQASAFDFYLRLGFRFCGEPFIEAGIPHRNMRYEWHG